MALKFPYLVKATSSTTGTGTYTVTEAAVAGWRTFTQAVADGDLADGDTVPYIVTDTSVANGPKLLEVGIGTWNNTSKTLARTQVLQPNGVAVNWGAGTRDVLVVDSPLSFLRAVNNLSDVASASSSRTNLGLGSLATANDAQRVALTSGQSGGTVGKVVRLSAANTWVDASQADTIDQLAVLAYKESASAYVLLGLCTGLSGLTAGAVYYLSTSGNITTTAPTPSSTVRRRPVGVALSTTTLLIQPHLVVGG